MFAVTNHERNANQNDSTSPPMCQEDYYQKQNKCQKEGRGIGTLAQLVGMQTGVVTMKKSMKIQFKKLKIELPYDASMSLLGTYPEELKSGF